MKGYLRKMRYTEGNPLQVSLVTDEGSYDLNQCLGRRIKLIHNGVIACCHCAAKTKKSYGGGYCYRCFMRLAECDLCILKPETCHRALGTCRNNDWSDQHCMQSHLVYLAYTSGIKVGLTRALSGLPRWYDQGALCAVPLAVVPDRLAAGKMEVFLKQYFKDKTQWKQMLSSDVDMAEAKNQLQSAHHNAEKWLEPWLLEHPFDRVVGDAAITCFNYPLVADKVLCDRLTFSKIPSIEGVLQGIKGQYLLLDCGVINIRQHTSYYVEYLC